MAYFIILFIELFSGSRGGVIANVSILVVYIMFKTNSKKIIRTFLIKVVIIFIFILSIILMIRYIPNWIIVRFMPGNIIDSNGSGRIHIWTKAIEFFVSQSFLAIMFGNGGFSFPRIAETFLGYRKYAHNVFIQSLIEGGVIGFLIVLYLYSIILVKAIKHKNIDQLALIVAAIIASMTLDFNLTRAFWFLFMLIFYQEAKPGNYFPALS